MTFRRRHQRVWPVRRYFLLLVILSFGIAVAAAWLVDHQAEQSERAEAKRESSFAAGVAAKQLGDHVALLRTTVSQLAANPQIEQILARPKGCTLTFAGLRASDASHLDIVRADGTVACSSQPITARGARSGYRSSGWFGDAVKQPLFLAPEVDELEGGPVAIATAPIQGRQGTVAAFLDLTSIGPELAAQYSAGQNSIFVVTTADRRAVVSRSRESKRWSGARLTPAQRRSLSGDRHLDFEGIQSLYSSAPVPGVDWTVDVGQRESDVLAGVGEQRGRQLKLVLLGLAVFLLAAALVYRKVVAPIRQLSLAVRELDPGESSSRVPVAGPAEVTALGEDVNSLIGAVQRELLERRSAEQAARASEENYRLLFETNPRPMWVYDKESLSFLAVNDAAVAAYGYSRDEFLSMSIADIRADTEVVRLEADLEAAPSRSGGFRHAGLWHHRRKDGSTLDVEITSHDHSFQGRRARVVMAIDVTERIRAEQSLRRTEARYRDLFENASDLIATADLDGRFTAVNEAFVRATGYTRAELIGMPLEQLVPEEHRDRLWLAREQKTSGAETTLYQHDLCTSDGGRISVEVASRLIEEDGVPIGTEAICRDISERILLEEQLRQAQRLEAVGRLAGGIAHDFNNVLTVISGYTDLLLAEDDRPAEELGQIAAAAGRASALTRQLLAFSRQQVLAPQALLVNDVVEGLLPMLRRLIGEDIELRSSLASELDPVLADAGQLEQVLVNLVVNARDAMPDGGRLTIQTARVDLDAAYVAHHGDATAGPHVMISVADNGSGMDAATRAHAFEPFYTTKPVGSGTGLGLATVHGIVKQSGGNVWVYSEPGKGTTIKIYLPVTDSAAPAARDSEPAGPESAKGVETVLLAEDEEALRTLVSRLLAQGGYTVISAESATDALRIAEDGSQQIDLLLTDLVMPEMSGRELAEQVDLLSPGLPVLFMSGYSDDALLRTGSLESGVPFIEKPFTGAALALKVRETIDSRAAAA